MNGKIYTMLVCLVGALILYGVYTISENDRTSSRSVMQPTAAFMMKLNKENKEAKESKKKGDESVKKCYLTFDDGPSDVTPKILNVLEKNSIHATFFLIGNELTGEREIMVKDMVASGHAIGIHTQTHEHETIYSNYENFIKDFNATKSTVERVTGKECTLHRYPWGSNNCYLRCFYKKSHKALEKMGVRSFDWNCSGEDAVGTPSVTSICAKVKENLCDHDETIILLHDGRSNERTADALQTIIDIAKEAGYGFDTLDKREAYLFPDAWR